MPKTKRPAPKDKTPPTKAKADEAVWTHKRVHGEMKVYGVNACKALWQNRAADIKRVYVSQERSKEFGSLLKWCAAQRKAYHVVADQDLERVSASVHHEGVVFLAREPERLDDEALLQRATALPAACPLLFLDNVANPHNIGSMLRIAAHFGVPLALGRAEDLPRMTPSAARMAEGGMEHVALAGLASPGATVEQLKKAGFKLVAAAADGATDLYATALPKRAIFAVGNEVRGLSPAVRAAADLVVRIPGTGAVESLNVAAAAGLLLGEFWRQHRPTTR